MYIKLMIDGATSKPFSAITIPLKESSVSFKDEIIARTKEVFVQEGNVTEDKTIFQTENNHTNGTLF